MNIRWRTILLIALSVLLSAAGLDIIRPIVHVLAQANTYNIIGPRAAITDHQTPTLLAVAQDTTYTPTTGSHVGHFVITFGTVTGSYSGCTAQIKTGNDGTAFLTLGGALSLTVSSGQVNAFSVIEQEGTTSVTTSAVSSTVALGYLKVTKITLSCSGYGTSAPTTIDANYH